MFFIADNSELSSPYEKTQDIFCVGGFFASGKTIKQMEMILRDIKNWYSIPEILPLKWNMKDKKITTLYEQHNLMDNLSVLISKSDLWREEIFKRLSDLDISLVVSGMRKLGVTSKEDVCYMLFVNLIERVVLEMKRFSDQEIIQIVLDWEQELRDKYCNIYSQIYYYGKANGSFSFPILQQQSNVYPALNFSVCIFNPLLQIADLIIGCYRVFFEYCFKGSHEELVKKLFPYIRRKTVSSLSGDPLGWGIVFRPHADENIIREKLIQLGMYKVDG